MNVKDFFQDTVGEERSLFFLCFYLSGTFSLQGKYGMKKRMYIVEMIKRRDRNLCVK